MPQQKQDLEIHILRWDYSHKDSDAVWDRYRYDQEPIKGDPNHYLVLPKHECEHPRECGLFLEAVEISLGSDNQGKCELLHDNGVRSRTNHEFELLKKRLPGFFEKDVQCSIGGAGRTTITFTWPAEEDPLDAGMEIYKGFLAFLEITDPKEIRRAKGPGLSHRNYFWSIELEGWIAYEDRLALAHGLRAASTRNRSCGKGHLEPFWWP